MSTDMKITPDDLAKLKANNFMDDQRVRARFIVLTSKVDKSVDAEEFYEQQANFMKRAIMANKKLAECTTLSLYMCFLDVPLLGMTLDPNANLLYFETRSYNLASGNSTPIWETRAGLKLTPYGELALRMECGQIKYIDNPVICYEKDVVKIRINDSGNKVIHYEANIPRTRGRIIFGFVKITRPDNSFDYHWMEEGDIERLKAYSNRNNKDKGANALYGGTDEKGNVIDIDPGFLAAKLIKHAFKAFPKAPIKGSNTTVEDDGNDKQQVYDLGNHEEFKAPLPTPQPGQTKPPVQEEQKPEPEPGKEKGVLTFYHSDF